MRVALTLDQVEAEGLIKQPFDRAKAKANRHPHVANWKHDFTVQLEALHPKRLAEILEEAIVSWMDRDAYQAALVEEAKDKVRLSWQMP
jgi:hypothetical protein